MGLWGGWKGVYPVRENPSWDGIPTTDHLLEEAIMVLLTQRPSSNWLVVEPYPSEKWWTSSMGRIIYPIYEMEKKSHVWNHQPVDQPVDISVTCLWSHWSYDQHEVQEIWIHRETYTPLKSAQTPGPQHSGPTARARQRYLWALHHWWAPDQSQSLPT